MMMLLVGIATLVFVLLAWITYLFVEILQDERKFND